MDCIYTITADSLAELVYLIVGITLEISWYAHLNLDMP